MKRILFLVLCIFVLQTQARAIEIIAHGQEYGSLQEYQASKKITVAQAPQVKQGPISGFTQHKLYVMSIENGMVAALQDFYQARGQPDLQMTRRISTEQLQEAIQQAVSTSKGVELLISQPGKVRIMALTNQGGSK